MLVPLNSNVVIRRDVAESVTKGGIVLPKNAQAENTVKTGTVLAVGPGQIHPTATYTEPPTRIKPTVQVNDRVAFGQYAGTIVTIAEEDVIVMSEDDILAVIK